MSTQNEYVTVPIASSNPIDANKFTQLRNKAFIPPQLPEDFLRIHLNQRQIVENQDILFAQRLQYGRPIVQRNPMWRVPPRGRLQFDIIEARLTKNYGFTKMDPYVRINLDGKIFESQTDYGGGKNPKWNKMIQCYLPQDVDSFVLELFDEKSFTTDEQIAVLHYTFPDEFFQGVVVDEWIPLSGRLGEQKEGHIHLQMRLIPFIQNQNQNQTRNTIPEKSTSSSSSSSSSSAIPRTNATSTEPTNVQLPSNNLQQQQQQQPQNQNQILYSEDDVKAIKEMFPTFDEDVIKSILDSNRGHKEATINMLLQMVTD